MNLSDYQREAAETDVLHPDDRLLPLIGLGGEVGQLMAEYKKRERDRSGYRAFRDEVREELGDILWYAAALARRNDLDLDQIAQDNLRKTRELFRPDQATESGPLYDDDEVAEQQLPRRLTVTLLDQVETTPAGETLHRVRMYAGDSPVGDPLDDNREHNDDYRYHDVFHLAHMAVLGWSPVMRRLLRRKRVANPTVDRVEDGGRAAAIEEGLTAFVFTEASEHSFFASATHVPPSLVKMCMRMTQHLEVANRTRAQWQHAILAGYHAFRAVAENGGGVLIADLDRRELEYVGPPPTQ